MKNRLGFLFADPAKHGGRGDSMGRPARSADKADRQGWAAHDASDGFSRPADRDRRRRFGRRN